MGRLPRSKNPAVRKPFGAVTAGSSTLQLMRRCRRPCHRAARKRPRRQGGPRVLLWPDSFNNYFRLETAIAAISALEALGYSVDIPKGAVCCGRPLCDWGRLDKANALWERNLTVLAG